MRLLNERNPSVQAAYASYCAAQSKSKFASTLPDPKISYSYYIKEVETRVGPQQHAVGVMQAVPWWGKLCQRQNVAEREISLAWQQCIATKVAAALQLKLYLLELHYTQSAITIQCENVHLLELMEEATKSRAQVGGAIADVLQINIEVQQLIDDISILREKASLIATEVNALLDQDLCSIIDIPPELIDLHLDTTHPIDLENANPQLLLSCLQVERQEALRCLAAQNRYPDVTVGVNWIQTGKAINPVPDNGKDPVVASISLSLPLWQHSYSAQEQEACYKKEAQEANWQKLHRSLQAQQKDIQLRHRAAIRESELYSERLLPDAKETLDILGDSYQAGKADFERYLGAQRLVLTYQLRVVRSTVNRLKAEVEYQALLGTF